MKNHLNTLQRALVIFAVGIMLSTSLSSCKATKCDCPEFGGHRLKH